MTSALDKLFAERGDAARVAPAPAAAPVKRDDQAALAELFAEADDPRGYRPYLARPHPVMGFAIIEKNGTAHGFQYHTMRHPKHQHRDGSEFLSLSADGQVIVIEGKGLAILFRALMRHVLVEIREFNGQPSDDIDTRISRVVIKDFRQVTEDERAALL